MLSTSSLKLAFASTVASGCSIVRAVGPGLAKAPGVGVAMSEISLLSIFVSPFRSVNVAVAVLTPSVIITC